MTGSVGEFERVDLSEEFDSVLVTRRVGARVASALAARLASLPLGSALVVDFSGVEILDYSFSDEALGKVGSRCVGGEFGERYLLVAGLTDELRENLESALRLREMPLAAIGGGQWGIVGPMRAHLAEVVAILGQRGQATAREVAGTLGIALNTASNRLMELHRLRVVRRSEAVLPGGGKQFVYAPLLRPSDYSDGYGP